MAEAYMCAHCGSTNLEYRMVDAQCLACGNRTSLDGRPLPKEPNFEGENPHNRRPV